MKNLLLTLTAVVLSLTAVTAQTPTDSVALVTAPWHIEQLRGGATLRTAQVAIFDSQQTLSVIEYRAGRYNIRFVQHDGVCPTSRTAAAAKADFAINASYWNVKTDEPVTYVRVDGRTLFDPRPSEPRCDGAIATDGRTLTVLQGREDNYETWAAQYNNIFVAGPVLRLHGQDCYAQLGSFSTKRHPRTVIGTRTDGSVVMIAVDGRVKDKAEGMSTAELTFVARILGLSDALNLDGGGSTTMWTAADGVVNHPCDNHRYDHAGERRVSSVVLFRRGKFAK